MVGEHSSCLAELRLPTRQTSPSERELPGRPPSGFFLPEREPAAWHHGGAFQEDSQEPPPPPQTHESASALPDPRDSYVSFKNDFAIPFPDREGRGCHVRSADFGDWGVT